MAARAWRGVLAASVIFMALATPAQATIRTGSGPDRVGDSSGPAGTDLVQTAAHADDAGRVVLGAQLQAAPASGAWVLGLVGTSGPSGCGAPYALFTGSVSAGVAVFQRETATSASDLKPATLSVEGNVVALAATDATLAVPFDCALAAISPDGTVGNLYDESDAPIALAPEAAPVPTPTPTPAATPAPVTIPQPVPAPTTATAPPVPVSKQAKLTVSLSGAPTTIRRNRTLTLKLNVTNDGSKRSSKVKISVGKARGLSVRRVATLSALKPAQKRTIKLRVKLTARAKASTNLKVTARAGRLKASSALLLRIGKARKAKPTPSPKKSPIVGTFWWRNVNHVDWAWDNRALYFVDGGSVYSGFPKGGLPATCTTPVAEPDEEFDTREGCLPYSFD